MRFAVLAALLLAGAACESDAPAPAAAVLDEDRPCEVATAAEVAAATGGEAGEARSVEARSSEASSKDGTRLCSYDVGPPYSTVILHVETDVSEDEFRDRMARDPLNTDPLDDVGELAFTHGGVGVSVWREGAAVSASLQKFDDPDEMRETVEELAELIDSKL